AHGAGVLGLQFPKGVVNRLTSLADKMPYYLHLLATGAARSALERGANSVTTGDVDDAVDRAAKDADQTLRDTYEDAILSSKGSHIYRRLVTAMAQQDDLDVGVAKLTALANEIAKAEQSDPVTPQAVGQALKKLASDEKKNILVLRQTGVYRF